MTNGKTGHETDQKTDPASPSLFSIAPHPGRRPAASASWPAWLARLNGAARGEEAGRPVVPAALIPTAAQAAWIERRIAERTAALAPAADCPRIKAEAIGRLFIALRSAAPAGPAADAIDEARATIYLDVLADLPGAAVAAGAMAWLRGDGLLAGENPAFVPTPPELRRLARAALGPLYREIAVLQRLRRAIPDRPPAPGCPPAPGRKEAVDALLAAHGWKAATAGPRG